MRDVFAATMENMYPRRIKSKTLDRIRTSSIIAGLPTYLATLLIVHKNPALAEAVQRSMDPNHPPIALAACLLPTAAVMASGALLKLRIHNLADTASILPVPNIMKSGTVSTIRQAAALGKSFAKNSLQLAARNSDISYLDQVNDEADTLSLDDQQRTKYYDLHSIAQTNRADLVAEAQVEADKGNNIMQFAEKVGLAPVRSLDSSGLLQPLQAVAVPVTG